MTALDLAHLIRSQLAAHGVLVTHAAALDCAAQVLTCLEPAEAPRVTTDAEQWSPSQAVQK